MNQDQDHVAHQLRELPELAWWLPRALITRTTTETTSKPKPGSRVPFKADIVDLLDQRLKLDRLPVQAAHVDPDATGVLPYLFSWARDTAFDLTDVTGTPPWIPTAPTIRTLCQWHRRHLDFTATLPQWPEFAWGIGYTWSRVEAATRDVRDDAPRHLVRHGQCDTDTPGNLHPISDREWRCDTCDRYIKIRAVTIPQAAKIATCTPRAIQKWVKAEPTRFAKVEYQGVRYFDLGQLLARAAEAKLSEALNPSR